MRDELFKYVKKLFMLLCKIYVYCNYICLYVYTHADLLNMAEKISFIIKNNRIR